MIDNGEVCEPNITSFSIPDFVFPEGYTNQVFLFQLVNRENVSKTISSISFKDKYNKKVPFGNDGQEVYIYSCEQTRPCLLNTKSLPFEMAPGQRIVVNGSIGVQDKPDVQGWEVSIAYIPESSQDAKIDNGKFECRVGEHAGGWLGPLIKPIVQFRRILRSLS